MNLPCFAAFILLGFQKVGEEGVEIALATMEDDKQEIIAESADFLYHLTVLLAAKNIELNEPIKELKSRHNP